jgi:hypothetical protein
VKQSDAFGVAFWMLIFLRPDKDLGDLKANAKRDVSRNST